MSLIGPSNHTQPPIKKISEEPYPIPQYTKKFKKYTENNIYHNGEAEPNAKRISYLQCQHEHTFKEIHVIRPHFGQTILYDLMLSASPNTLYRREKYIFFNRFLKL